MEDLVKTASVSGQGSNLRTSVLGEKMLTPEEIRHVRDGVDGIRRSIPARFYYDEDLYQFEVEHVLKKGWLYVGRWDEAKNPGDYFTREMFGESIIIIRDKSGELRAHANVCRHRWSRLLPAGSGNTNLLVCPYHSWSYDLDGRLRGVASAEIPGLDKSKCNLHSIRLEVWQGFIFINFDKDAEALNPQLEGLTALVKDYGLQAYEMAGETVYDANWNYKFSFETGYEGYHADGIHRATIGGTGRMHRPYKFGGIWGSYIGEYNEGKTFPYGRPPWMGDDDRHYPAHVGATLYAAIYPNMIMVLWPHSTLAIRVEHMGATKNRASTFMTIAPWARERSPEKVVSDVEFMKLIQSEDTLGCQLVQAGVTSQFNTDSFLHPNLEGQLSHFHNWYIDRILEGAGLVGAK